MGAEVWTWLWIPPSRYALAGLAADHGGAKSAGPSPSPTDHAPRPAPRSCPKADTGALGGRPHHWQREPFGHWHSGRTNHTFHHAGASGGQPCGGKSPRQASRDDEYSSGLSPPVRPWDQGTDLGLHTPEHLAIVAAEINRRPREILGWHRPVEHMARPTATPSEP